MELCFDSASGGATKHGGGRSRRRCPNRRPAEAGHPRAEPNRDRLKPATGGHRTGDRLKPATGGRHLTGDRRKRTRLVLRGVAGFSRSPGSVDHGAKTRYRRLHAPPRRDPARAAPRDDLGAAPPARHRRGDRRAAAGQRRLARARARAALGARPARALPAADRGRRLPAHGARGQPADGPAPARPARPRRGARGGARADPRDGAARDRGVVLQLDAGRLVVAHVGRAARAGWGGGDRVRRVGLGGRDANHGRRPSRRRRSGRRSPGSSSAPSPSRRRQASSWPSTRTTRRSRPFAASAASSARSTPTTASSSSSRARRTG